MAQIGKIKIKIKLPLLLSSQTAQDSNDRPNKLSRRTSTRSQTRPVC